MKRMVVALGVLALVCAAAQAQEAEPGADLKKLDVWVGDWAWDCVELPGLQSFMTEPLKFAATSLDAS